MDVTIPGHLIKTFASAISALQKVSGSNKDLYLDFDPLDGLFLRSINDAKSAFMQFHFETGFFERCSTSLGFAQNRKRRLPEHQSQSQIDNFSCRLPARSVSSLLRNRKGIKSLRIRCSDDKETEQEENDQDEKSAYSMKLSFDFELCAAEDSGFYRIVHRIGIADARGVMAVATKEECSEIVVKPTILMNLIDPLKKTNEIALTVNGSLKMVTATSFHHRDAISSAHTHMNHQTLNILKTETTVDCGEFYSFEFVDNRFVDENLPELVNDEVVLVFGLKEVKAMTQFCCQQSIEDEEASIVVSFHWGGCPIVFELEGNSLSAQLILATLDHKLLQKKNGPE